MNTALVIVIYVSLGFNILFIVLFLEQRRLIHTDTLTGLLNRVGLAQKRNRRRSKKNNTRDWPFMQRRVPPDMTGAVLYLDLDKFKPVNTKYGHHVGDMVILEFSKFLRQEVRAKDTIARLHGDEFVLVLEGIGEKEARVVAKKIAENIKKHEFLIADYSIKLEATIGVSAMRVDEEFNLDLLIKKADQEMLNSKKSLSENR